MMPVHKTGMMAAAWFALGAAATGETLDVRSGDAVLGLDGTTGALVRTILERIDYPLLSLAAPLEGDGAGDALVFGTTKGGVVERPHQLKPAAYIMGGVQSGSLAAQFGCYYGSKGGVVTRRTRLKKV